MKQNETKKQRNAAKIQTTQNLIKKRTRIQTLKGSDPVFVLYKFDACPYCRRVQKK